MKPKSKVCATCLGLLPPMRVVFQSDQERVDHNREVHGVTKGQARLGMKGRRGRIPRTMFKPAQSNSWLFED